MILPSVSTKYIESGEPMEFRNESAAELIAEFEDKLANEAPVVHFMLISENRLLGDEALTIMKRGDYKKWLNWVIWAIEELESNGVDIDEYMKNEFNEAFKTESKRDIDLEIGKLAEDFKAQQNPE